MKKFKRFFAVFVCVALLLGSTPLSGFVGLDLPSLFGFLAAAETYNGSCGENLTWALDTDSGELNITGTGAMDDWEQGEAPWYSYRSNIKTINIESGVTSIGHFAFHDCKNLTNITIPNDITTIGDYAFTSCSNITDITMPDSIVSIGEGAFLSCYNLASITLSDSITVIPAYTFDSCMKLASIIIPEGVTSIGECAFNTCDKLSSITIGSEMKDIGFGAFTDCFSITDIYYGSTEEDWDKISIRSGNDPLTGATIHFTEPEPDEPTVALGTCGDSLTWTLYESGLLEISGTGDMEIYSYSSFPWYSYRSSITAVNITSGVTSIGDYAFCYCERITTVTIPDSVKTIGEYVFVDCYDLASITIPVSVESIGQYAFGWYAIPYYSGTLEQWEAVETSSSDTSIDSRVIICGGTDRPYYIPGTCSTNVNWILYADGELVISGTGAMTNWSSASDAPWYSMSEKIKSITVENGVRSIGKYAFYNCNQVSKVTIADTVLIIEYYGFYGCSAKELTMPATVGIAGSTVFDNCMQIEKITLTKGSGVMHDYTTNTDSSYCYRYTPWYESRPKEIVIEDGVTNIGNYTFNSVNYLESIRIPASVTTIGVGAFGNCTDLTDVYYASTMEDWNKITTGSENEPLDTATIHTVTYSGTCGDNLTWVLYDTGRLEINGTGAMTSWTAANQTPWFNYSTGINEIIIGNGVTSIGKYAFFSCTVQKSVTISNSVTSIEASAFGNSQSITEIHYASDKSDWDKITVGGTNNALTQAQFDYGVKRLIAYGHVGELVEWELYTDGELSVIGEGGMSNYTSAEYYPWHKYRDIITSFTLDTYPGEYYPEMTNIGSHALEGCSNLETVRIYSVLRTIGDYAFAGCTSLKSIVIPDTVTNIGDGAFYGCSGLNELTMPVSAKIYNSPDVFYGCTGIGKITLTKGNGTMVTYGTDTSPTASSVYYQYTPWYISVTQIDLTIEEGITAIPSYTFYGSKSIQNVTIPEGVTSIGEYAFCGNIGLKNITLPASISSIGVYAFYGCSALEKTYYGGDITGWCKIDFKDAYSTPMCFADNLYFVGELVTEVYISSTVTSIRNYTFYGCSGIKNVYYGSTEEDWNKISIGSYNEPLTSATIHFNTTQCKHSTDDLIWHTVVEPTCASGKENAVCSVCGYNGYYEVLCDSETYPNCVGKNQEFVDKTYSFTYPGAEKLILKFSEKTNIYEYLYIYNAKGDMIDCYTTDSQLAGKTVEVDGDSVDLRIVAETLYSWNGFSFDSIIAIMSSDDWIRETPAVHNWNNGACGRCEINCAEPLNSAVIDNENNEIYGLAAGIESLNDFINPADGLKWIYEIGQYGFGTGTIATLKNGDETVAEYTVLIFGDVDGNGWYDANDAFIVNMLANGLVSPDRLSEAQQRAADCNHDGEINELDFEILNRASLLIEDIDQSATKAELESDEIYIEYMSLIDQSTGVNTEETAPETNEATDKTDIETIFAAVFEFIRKIFAFVLSFIVG